MAYSNKDLFLTYVYVGRGQAAALFRGVFWFQNPGRRDNSPVVYAHSSGREEQQQKKLEIHMLKHGMSHIY